MSSRKFFELSEVIYIYTYTATSAVEKECWMSINQALIDWYWWVWEDDMINSKEQYLSLR